MTETTENQFVKIGGGKYLAINGLRAYAAIGIVAMHVLANVVVKPSHCFVFNDVVAKMGELVLLFMMVSAFGMCCGYYRKFKSNAISLNDFFAKRYSRILPYFACLVALDLIISPSWKSLVEAFEDLTLVYGLYPDAHIEVIGVGWFLGAIFLFYMLFPFFVFLMDNKRRAWFVLAIAIIWQLAMMHLYNAGHNTQPLFQAPYFIVGGLLFLYKDSIQTMIARVPSLFLIICILLTVVFYFPLVHTTYLGANLPRLILYSAWLMFAIGSNHWLLDNKITAYLSGISMEIYLCHMVMFRVIERLHTERFILDGTLNYVVTFVLTLMSAILFAHVTKYYVLPFISNVVGKVVKQVA